MRKDTLINLRINNNLKEEFQEIVEMEGFTMSEVLEGAMIDITRRKYVPINIRSKIRRQPEKMVSIPFIKECLEKAMKSPSQEKVKSVALFGSYATGTANPKSDVDLFLEIDEGYSLFNMFDLQTDLEKSLGKKVDLVTKSDDAYFMSHVQKEKIQLYERNI